jgi:hypothetical protein
LLGVLAACSQFVVRSRHDPEAAFASLRTFAWLPASEASAADQRTPDPTFDDRIRMAVDRELRAKGYVPATDARPDFLLNYRWTTTPTSAVRGDPSRRGWGDLWLGWDGSRDLYTESYDRGSLFVGIVSAETKRPMWVGVAEARVLPNLSYERTLKRIDAAIDRILEGFPPD